MVQLINVRFIYCILYLLLLNLESCLKKISSDLYSTTEKLGAPTHSSAWLQIAYKMYLLFVFPLRQSGQLY